MIEKIRNIFSIPELRDRIVFTLSILASSPLANLIKIDKGFDTPIA